MDFDRLFTLQDFRDYVEHLESRFPPRCLRVGENEKEHLIYAGKVELIQEMRNCLEQDRNE